MSVTVCRESSSHDESFLMLCSIMSVEKKEALQVCLTRENRMRLMLLFACLFSSVSREKEDKGGLFDQIALSQVEDINTRKLFLSVRRKQKMCTDRFPQMSRHLMEADDTNTVKLFIARCRCKSIPKSKI